MNFGKVFKIFKKGAKVASKGKGKKGAVAGQQWPGGIRIGLYGHANAGKTVYFTVLNEECKIAKDLQLSATDSATAGYFLSHYRSIWGLGTTSDVGTVVDLKGEKAFPEPTKADRLLLCNAIIDRSKKLSFVSYDYPGKAVAISGEHELRDKVLDFMVNSHGLLFLFDPKALQSDTRTQAHVASFVSMLEHLAPITARLPIPIGLVVTKAEILDGFSGDNQSVLVSSEDEHLLSEDFELFLEKMLASPGIKGNPAWAGSVRTVLVKLRDFLKLVIGRTLDFQIFFVSSTGSEPEKIGSDVGRSVYRPPNKINPIGVRQPMRWLLSSIVRNRRISRFRTVAKYAAVLSIIWMLVYSAPFLLHFKYLLPRAQAVEGDIMTAYEGDITLPNDTERGRIYRTYERYERSWTVKWLFPKFIPPSGRIREAYKNIDLGKKIQELDQVILRFVEIAKSNQRWPKVNPGTGEVVLLDEHTKLIADLESFRKGDETSMLYMRSDRVLELWRLFTEYLSANQAAEAHEQVLSQISFYTESYSGSLSATEKNLGSALQGSMTVRKEEKERKEVAQKAAEDLSSLFATINGNEDPAYRLGTAVDTLQKIKRALDKAANRDNIKAIDRYIRDAEKFKQQQRYRYKIESIPGEESHLHVEVVAGGQPPKWSVQNQWIQGFDYSLDWKIGDHVYLALDTTSLPESYGKSPHDLKVFDDDYALFRMDGEIAFRNAGKTVLIKFDPPLKGRLPSIK